MKYQTNSKPKRMIVECLSCGEGIYVGRNPKVGSFITCHSCDALLEIIDIEPIMIDWPYYDDDESFSDSFEEGDDY